MIICPYCGTNYQSFQPNCKNCGAPLPPPASQPAPETAASYAVEPPLAPPPAPRPVADSYALRLMASDVWGIVGLIFALIGGIFVLTGAGLTLGIITAIVGIPFLGLGLAFLAAGAALASNRYQAAMQTVRVLREGQATLGTITSVEQERNVRVNRQFPWTIDYQFTAGGHQQHKGRVTTFNTPGVHLQPGRSAYVLYSPQAPQHNALYPHP